LDGSDAGGMAGLGRTGCGTAEGNRNRPTVSEGVLPEGRQPRARTGRRRDVRWKWKRGGGFRARLERTKERRGGIAAQRGLSSSSTTIKSNGELLVEGLQWRTHLVGRGVSHHGIRPDNASFRGACL